MTQDKRKFLHKICVKSDTKKAKFELACASEYGGEVGKFRVRQDRCWIDSSPDTKFFDVDKISKLIASFISEDKIYVEKPIIPHHRKVLYPIMRDGIEMLTQVGLKSEPILDYSGEWKIYIYGYGFKKFVNFNELQFK